MNTAEHLVELYFRLCHDCLTVSDVKVAAGNGRQIDLLAYQPIKQKYLHVEVSVTHKKSFAISFTELAARIDKKFFGVSTNRANNPSSDAAKDKSYLAQIEKVYTKYGATRENILHVFCIWNYEPADVEAWQNQLGLKYGTVLPAHFKVLSFRDEVLPRLEHEIGTANYDDELARLLSLQKARAVQRGLPITTVPAASPFQFSF